MSQTKFTSSGVLIFPDLGKDGKVTGPFPGLTVTAKRTVKDVEFALSVPTAKAAKDNTLNGTVLSLKNNWKAFETKAQIDLGTKFKSAGTLYKKNFDAPGRALDLELLWKEKGSEVELGAAYKLDKQKKLSGKYNLAKQLGIATLSYEKDGFTLEPSLKYDVEKQQSHPVLAISQKKGADTLKASYDIDGEAGTLEWSRNPYKVIVRSTITHKGGFNAKPPMVMLQLNKDFEVGGNSGGPSGKLHPDSLRASEPHAKSGGLVSLEESRQGSLSERLKAIDAVNLEKKRDLTAANIRKNREGNKGTVAGHD